MPILAGTKKQLEHDAWDIGVSYLVTGENASFKGVKPKNDFDLDKGGWGAWELVARYSEINLDSNTFKNPNGAIAGENLTGGTGSAYADSTLSAKSANTWTVGANWYLNENTKFQINYAQTSFDGGSISGTTDSTKTAANLSPTIKVADRPDEKAILARFQVAF